MKPLIAGLISAVAVSASANPFVQQPIMPSHMPYGEENPPPPAIKFKSANTPPPQDTAASDHGSNNNNYEPNIQSHISLSDAIGPLRSISSFSSFTRLCASTSSLLADLSTNTTVLAPLNSAIDSLPRKPWESPADYHALGSQAYDGSGGQDRANKNLLKFVQAHLVTTSPWKQGEKAKTLAGTEVWWDDKAGQRVIMPDGIAVDKVASRVANGELWIIKGVVNYEK